MKTLPEKLESLAGILDKKAELSDALAVDHEMNREAEPALHARRRAASARQYAAVSREAAKALTTRQQTAAKRAAFVPPTPQDVISYAASRADMTKWPDADILAWHNHFESVGWRVNTKPMVDWKAAAANGYRRWQEKVQPAPAGPNSYVPPSDAHFSPQT